MSLYKTPSELLNWPKSYWQNYFLPSCNLAVVSVGKKSLSTPLKHYQEGQWSFRMFLSLPEVEAYFTLFNSYMSFLHTHMHAHTHTLATEA